MAGTIIKVGKRKVRVFDKKEEPTQKTVKKKEVVKDVKRKGGK